MLQDRGPYAQRDGHGHGLRLGTVLLFLALTSPVVLFGCKAGIPYCAMPTAPLLTRDQRILHDQRPHLPGRKFGNDQLLFVGL